MPEIKIQQIEVNAEVNGMWGNDTALPLAKHSGQDPANLQLISTNKAGGK